MSDIVLDAAGDIDISTGSILLNTGVESVRQNLYVRLRTFFGEWFLDTSVGVPYLQQIMGIKNPSPVLLASIFRREILKCPGVRGVNALDFQIDTALRSLNVSASILSADGVIDFSQEIEVA